MKHFKNNRIIKAIGNFSLIFTVILQSVVFSFPTLAAKDSDLQNEASDKAAVLSRQLVLHYGGSTYKETISHLENSLFASKEIDSLNIMEAGFSAELLAEYDVVYIDESIFLSPGKSFIRNAVTSYVYNGGAVFMPNSGVNYFSDEFLGITDQEKLNTVPTGIVNAAKGTDMEKIGELICDFSELYKGYTYYEEYLKNQDYGYSFKVTTALPIVTDDAGRCIYALNSYGNGYVFITNPLLPNTFNINSADREKSNILQLPFAPTSAGANSLLKGYFASFVSKKTHGFSLERTFGSYGTQPIAWQLHYEELTGIQNSSSILFSEICKKYSQVPSFTLIRNTYKWFARYESISYLKIKDNICSFDFEEGAYSNGTHVISDNFNLYTVENENTGSYFEDLATATQRLFPCIVDLDNDGIKDIVAGSSDGKFYFFKTISTDGRWICDKGVLLTSKDGVQLSVGKYSAPVVFDFDNDGILDIISGDYDGNIVFFKGISSTSFEKPITLTTITAAESMPVIGDLDNDGENELIVGSSEGKVFAFEIKDGSLGEPVLIVDDEDETFFSPCVYDINNDGKNDLLCGTFNGYVKRYLCQSSGLAKRGYIMSDEPNYKGNSRIKFGNNASPRFFDANGDGEDELVCGSYEYGLNVPINSKYFPYKDELKKQISYILNNNFYLGVHFYTNAFASSKREKKELELHKKAFEDYGISTDGVGVNQHTWYTSSNTDTQSYKSASESSLLWDSGWQSSGSRTAPQSNTENVLGFPVFIDRKKSFLTFNTSTLLYLDDEISDLTAKYKLPLSIYYHCDFTYADSVTAEKNVQHVADYVKRNKLSFVKEDQLAKMSAASSNFNVLVKKSGSSFALVPTTEKTDFQLYDKAYADVVGVRIEICKDDNINKYSSNADFYFQEDNSLTVTLNKEITVDKTDYLRNDKTSHISSVNVPCKINFGEGMATLSFDDGSYVEIKVFGKAETNVKNLTSEYDGQYTIFKGFKVKNATVIFKK